MSEWYEKSFGDDYLLVYKHRDLQGAYEEVRSMMEWLELPEGAEVLDLCCGMGRHSMALNSFGFKVTGVDLSEVLLAEARRLDTDGEVNWVHGDMRDVPLAGPFAAVVNLFTSFGYFDADAENERVLREMYRLLVPGGRFIIDYLNPEFVKASVVPHSERRDGNLRIVEDRRIEDGFVRKRIVLQGDGEAEQRVYDEQVKLLGREWFQSHLNETGLAVDAVYGCYDASPYEPATSKRLILVGRRES
ncbi:class I SAM-dependent methyltransferase [Paenibacillus allorhizosphaerae]|uniref:2-methoxy-6-polyprenyl-1,4-benzoquinol methylase, mitochondrial n=1 Tax=Paenibacillus allorhizosphaerae TaxID=2849866 RepID=A0ABM8VL15_9BACL|nr:class I SAM-dependent methyltransferase [Paenibacillus allorhizosphaerae]CAG7647915.1 2-methoxy-6-polyprenyl-1,4-benzoquinol methylase, mitochondrial [Paenibacillus allorhizosphaerae]